MDEGDLREEIVDLETRIEELGQVIENCTKIIQISRVAIAVGSILFLAIMFGAITFDPLIMILAIAAAIGGVVVLGSNRSTSAQANVAMQAAELRRTELISAIDLRVIGE